MNLKDIYDLKLSGKGVFQQSRSSKCYNFPLGTWGSLNLVSPFLRIFKNTLLSAFSQRKGKPNLKEFEKYHYSISTMAKTT